MKSLNSIIGSGKVAKSIVALFSLGLSFLLFSLFARDQIQIDGSLEAQTYIQNIIYIFICVAVLILLIPYYNEINFKKIKYEHLIYAALIILLIGTLFHPRFNAKFIPVFGILTIINLIITKKAQKPEPILYYYIAAYIIFCIGLLWSNDRESGGNLLETKLAMLVYPIAFSFFTLKRDAAKTIMLIFFKAALIFTLASLLCWVLEAKNISSPLEEWILIGKKTFLNYVTPYNMIYSWSNYSHPSYINIALSFAFICGFFLFKDNTKKRITLLELILYGSAFLTLIIITQSRIGIILFAAITGYFIFFSFSKKYRIIFAAISIIIAAVGINKKSDVFTSDQVREQQYKIALSYFIENPILGVGTGGIDQVMTSEESAHRIGDVQLLEPETAYPHNQFIGEMLHLGILGLLALLLVIIPLVFIAIKEKNYLMGILMIAYFLLMLIEMPIYHQRGTATFFLFTTFALYLNKLKIGKRL